MKGLNLTTDAEYVAHLVNINVVVNVHSAVYYMGMLYLHNDIFLY